MDVFGEPLFWLPRHPTPVDLLKLSSHITFSLKHPLLILPLKASPSVFCVMYKLPSLHGLACIAYINFLDVSISLLGAPKGAAYLSLYHQHLAQYTAYSKHELNLFIFKNMLGNVMIHFMLPRNVNLNGDWSVSRTLQPHLLSLLPQPCPLSHLLPLKSQGLSNPSWSCQCLSHPHLSICNALPPPFLFYESLFILQGTSQKFSLWENSCLLQSLQYIIHHFLIGVLRYFVHICITYLTLCFAGLCTYLLPP